MEQDDLPALHLVPGTLCDERLWHAVTPHLSELRISQSDYRGAATLDAMIEAVAADIPAGAHVAGFSLGGYLAAEAVLVSGAQPASLTLIATALTGLSEDEKFLRRRNADVICTSAYRGMSRRRLAQFIHPTNLTDESVTGTILDMERDLGKEVMVNQLLASIERRDLTALLPMVDFPVHLIAAAEDAITDNAPMQALADAGAATLNTLGPPEAITGHMIPLEAPHALASALRAVL